MCVSETYTVKTFDEHFANHFCKKQNANNTIAQKAGISQPRNFDKRSRRVGTHADKTSECEKSQESSYPSFINPISGWRICIIFYKIKITKLHEIKKY